MSGILCNIVFLSSMRPVGIFIISFHFVIYKGYNPSDELLVNFYTNLTRATFRQKKFTNAPVENSYIIDRRTNFLSNMLRALLDRFTAVSRQTRLMKFSLHYCILAQRYNCNATLYTRGPKNEANAHPYNVDVLRN